MIYKNRKVPVPLTSTLAVNIIYCLVATIIVGLYTFNSNIWLGVEDDLQSTEATRRDQIEISSVVFLAISSIVGISFFYFYKHVDNITKYYRNYLIIFGLLTIAFITLTVLQFYYWSQDSGEIYQFTRWWVLSALVLSLLILYMMYRYRKLSFDPIL